MTSGNPIQITHQISIPLNEENYRQNFPHWGSQVLGVLGSLGLQHYLDVTVGHGERWKQDQDQIIRNWLSSSLPPPIVFELSNKPCATAYQLWICLCMMHTMNYFPTVRQLKLSLQMIEKGHATCTQYLQQFNFIVNGLLYMGAAITEQELMHYILKGLGQQFPIIVTDCMLLLLTGSPVNMASFQERLVQEERRLVPLEEERHRLFVARQGQYARPSYSQPATYYSQPVRRTNAGPSQYAPPSLSLSLSLSQPVNSYSQPGPSESSTSYSNFPQPATYYSQHVRLPNAGPSQYASLPLSQPSNSYSQPGPSQYARPSYSQPATYYSQPVRRTNASPSQYAPPSLSLSLSQPVNSYSQPRPSESSTSYSNFPQPATYYSQPVRLPNAGPSQYAPLPLSRPANSYPQPGPGQYTRPSCSQPATYYSQPVRVTNAGPNQYASPSLSHSLSQPVNSYSQPGPSQPSTSYNNFYQTATSHSQLNSNSQTRALGVFLAQPFQPTNGAGQSITSQALLRL